jgi:hypothetical protein
MKGVFYMIKEYSVVPNKDENLWLVKLEDAAPAAQFGSRSAAVEEAEKMAKDNKPSKVTVMDDNHEVIDEKLFQ